MFWNFHCMIWILIILIWNENVDRTHKLLSCYAFCCSGVSCCFLQYYSSIIFALCGSESDFQRTQKSILPETFCTLYLTTCHWSRMLMWQPNQCIIAGCTFWTWTRVQNCNVSLRRHPWNYPVVIVPDTVWRWSHLMLCFGLKTAPEFGNASLACQPELARVCLVLIFHPD